MQRYIKLIVCGEILAMLALAIFIGYLIAAPSNKQRGRPVRRYVDTLVYVPSNQSDTKKHMWALDADVDVGKIIVALPVAAGDASGRASFGNIMTFKEFYDAKPFGKGRAVEYWLRIRDGETPATEDIAKEIRALRASGFNIRGVMIVDEVVKREPWWETIRAQNLKFGVLGSKGWTAGYPTATGVPAAVCRGCGRERIGCRASGGVPARQRSQIRPHGLDVGGRGAGWQGRGLSDGVRHPVARHPPGGGAAGRRTHPRARPLELKLKLHSNISVNVFTGPLHGLHHSLRRRRRWPVHPHL